MATTIKLENQFADKTTRTLQLGTFDDNNPYIQPETLKASIFNINDNASDLNGLYYSSGGASFVEITSAEIIIEEKTVINL